MPLRFSRVAIVLEHIVDDVPRLLFAIPSYAKDAAATADIMADLIDHMAACGLRADVFCSNNNSSSRKRRAPVYERHGLVEIHRWSSPLRISGRYNQLYYLFGLFIYTLVNGHKYRVVVTTDEPYGASFIIALLRICYPRIRPICWVPDIGYIRTGRQTGQPAKRFVVRLVGSVVSWSYRRATRVVVLGSCMRRLMEQQGISPHKLVEIPPWPPIDPDQTLLAVESSFPDAPLTILYSGHLGPWHEVSTIMKMLEESSSLAIRFVFSAVGEGMSRIREFANRSPTGQVVFQDRVAVGDLRRHLEAAHIHLATLAIDMEGTCVPSKVYAAMCVGRPVIFIGPRDCQAARDIEAANGGFVIAPDDEQALLCTIQSLAANPGSCRILGANALAWYKKHKSRRVALNQWSEMVHTLLSHGRANEARASQCR
jgi:glycosyltransferase involved in cell wall biosynthesis